MTREETVKIIRVMSAAYPNFKPTDISETIDVWNMMLSDYTYNEIAVALKIFITTDTSGFAPSIAQLLDKVRMVEEPAELNEMEAWSLVTKAIRNGYYGAEEEFAKLPPVVQKAVGNPALLRQWGQADTRSVETVIQSNFLRSYNTVIKRENDMAKMPEDIRKMIESTNKPQIEQKANMG